MLPYARGRKDKSGSSAMKRKFNSVKEKPFVGLTDGMALLYPRSSSEYSELVNGPQAYLESVHEKLISQFGSNGSFIKGLAYRTFTAPVAPRAALSQNSGPSRVAWKVYEDAELDHARDKKRLEEDKPKMFGIMMGNISPASKLLIKSHADWGTGDLDVKQDPLLLAKLITKSHMSENTGSTELDKSAALREYTVFRYIDGEHLDTYKRRLVACVGRMEAIGCSYKPTEMEQVSTFALGLRGPYASYSTEYQNKTISNSADLPKTLSDVYQAAMYFKSKSTSDHGRGGNRDPGVAFYTAQQVDAAVRSALESANGTDTGGGSRSQSSFAAHAKGKEPRKPPKGKGKGLDRKLKPKVAKGNGVNRHLRFSGIDEIIHDAVKDHDRSSKKVKRLRGGGANNGHNESDNDSDDPRKRCDSCGFYGHVSDDCKRRDKIWELCADGAITLFTLHVPTTLTASAETLGPYDVLLDSQSNTNAFRTKKLLTKFRRIPDYHLSGMASGASLTANRMGRVKGIDFGDVYLFEEATANVLSLDKVSEMGYPIHYDQMQRSFTVSVPGFGDLVFQRRHGGLHVCDFSFLLDRESGMEITDQHRRKTNLTLFNTVADNERRYKSRDVIRARRARKLLRRMGYTPPVVVGRMLNGGAVTNCETTSSDITTASDIYGKLVAELRGKAVRQKGLDILSVEPGQQVGPLELVMHTDVIYVNRWAVLLSVFDPINLTVSRCIDTSKRETNKPTARDLRLALDETLNEVMQRPTLVVVECHADGEFNNEEVKSPFVNRHIKTTICSPGDHVVRVERKARVVKERVRCHLSNLPFLLPSILLPWLIAFVMFCLNAVPVRWGGYYVSPREIMTGRKLDASRELRHEFGEYVEAINPHAHSNSVTDARTEACITLLNTGNGQGDVYCYKLSNGEVVRRSHWTSLPMPDTVIDNLNALATAEPAAHQVTASPDFYVGNGTVRLNGQSDIGDEEEQAAAPGNDNYVADDEYNGNGPWGVNGTRSPTVTPTTVPTLEYTLADNQLTSGEGDVLMDLTHTNTPDGGPVINYMLGSTLESGGGTHYAFMVHARKVAFLSGKCFRMSIRAAEKRRGIDETAATLKKELKQMLSKKVWRPEHWKYLTREEKRAVIRSSLFLKEKYDAEGLYQKLKARLVAGGDRQDRTIYSDAETSSPTVSTSSVFMLATIAAKEKRKVVTLDYSGAYLNAKLRKSVRMLLEPKLAELLCEMDPSYRKYLRMDGYLCVKLDKALYGCVESAKLWYDLISSQLRDHGFVPNDYDPCVFNKVINGRQVTIALYVDDLMITCASQWILDGVIQQLESMFDGSTVHRGATHSYIGMLFDFSNVGRVHVRMDGYIDDFLSEYEVKGSAPTPSKSDLFEVDRDSELLDPSTKDVFHSRVAKVLYCAKRSRPDLLTTTSFLATRVQAPTFQDYDKLQRLLRYVNGTRDLWLTLEAGDGWGLFAYIDAAYGQHLDGKSHTGVCMLLGKGAFYVQSSKQKIVSKSSTEAELVAVSDGLSEVIWARNFLLSQGVQLGPAVVYQDNMSTMALMEKGRSTSSRTKHINIRYFFVKDRVEAGEVVIKYAPTEEMLADILTKPLQGELFRKLRQALLNLRSQHSKQERTS